MALYLPDKMTDDRINVVIDDKYTVTQDSEGAFVILRHGEPWMRMTGSTSGDECILAMAHEIERLRRTLATCHWHWPADETTSEACCDSWQEVLLEYWGAGDLEDLAVFSRCWNAPIARVAVENPVMHKHAKARIQNFSRHAQSVQPWQFGVDPDGPDNVKKRTCFWLRGLPQLVPTGTLDGSTARDEIHKEPPGPDRAARRSRFFPGLADAMADQWGGWAEGELPLAFR